MPRLTRYLRYCLLVLAAGYIVAYLVIALARIGYPFALEWMESDSLDSVRRILAGQPLYVQPSLSFTPSGYPPLYFYAAAALARVLGIGFPALRLVSLVSSLAVLALIFLIVRRESGSNSAGLLGAGLFAACFRLGGAWFDLARVDSLFLGLMLAAICVLRFGKSRNSAVAAGVLVFLSVLTKQTALFIVPALALYLLLTNWRRGVWFVVSAGLLVAGSFLVINEATHGWFKYYVFDLPATHHISETETNAFWTRDLVFPLFGACIVAFVWFFRQSRDLILFYALLLVGGVLASFLVRIRQGTYVNVLLPAYALLAIVFGLGLSEPQEPGTPGRRWSRVALVLIGILQLAALRYDFTRQVPSAQDRRAGQELVQRIAGTEGEVLAPFSTSLVFQAGKRTWAGAGWLDVVTYDAGPKGKAALEELKQALSERGFALVILPRSNLYQQTFQADVNANYRATGAVFDNPEVFQFRTGADARPESVYVAKGNELRRELKESPPLGGAGRG
jgi:4-amino-4-deoxy-L-arabinose transferase-like glycosyltransferase